MNQWIGKAAFVIVVVLAAFLVIPAPGIAVSQTAPASLAGGSDVQLVSSMLPGGTQQVVVLDNAARTMAVYHVEPSQGKIQLKSVRTLVWDLRMEQFNANAPLPSELRQVQP